MSKKRKPSASSKAEESSRATDPAPTAGAIPDPANAKPADSRRDSPGAPPDDPPPPVSRRFARYFSFALLIGIIILVGILFYEVMAQFLVPLFLSAILVVVFRPLHKWILERCHNRAQVAALLTTVTVLLMVLVPLGIILMLAAAESRQVVRQFNTARLETNIRTVRAKLGLELPPEIAKIDREFDLMLQRSSLTAETEDIHRIALFEAESAARSLADRIEQLDWPQVNDAASESEDAEDSEQGTDEVADPAETKRTDWQVFAHNLVLLRAQHDAMFWGSRGNTEENQARMKAMSEYQSRLDETAGAFSRFKIRFLGGKSKSWLTEMANPSQEKYNQYVSSAIEFLRGQLLSLSGKGLAVVAKLLIGTTIMMIGFYFFLLDGPAMLETFKGLSPVEDDHEQELVIEFERVTRGVVIATLLSAATQGVLAGFGFYVVGLESVFLLTVMTGLLAMVPFVGAASVWVPCALYLYLVDNNPYGAIGLALYGAAIISMADNVIKPLVLHGQSNLHPLLAFLSVIGGVSALGPIGILIGPMVVAFLQTLLRILRNEVTDLDQFGGEAAT